MIFEQLIQYISISPTYDVIVPLKIINDVETNLKQTFIGLKSFSISYVPAEFQLRNNLY